MSETKKKSDVVVRNVVLCRVCGASADKHKNIFQCTENPGHIADLNTGIFVDLTYPQGESMYQNDTQKERQ